MKDLWVPLLIFIIAIAITLVVIFIAWLKGEFRKITPYPYHRGI